MSRSTPTTILPFAHGVLRVLLVLNALSGLGILGIFALSLNSSLIIEAFKISPSPTTDQLIWGLRAIAVLGLIAIAANHHFLKQLLAIAGTVREGTPFVASNAARLRVMAWTLAVIQVLGMLIGGIGRAISTPQNPLDIDAGFSINGWLAVLVIFVLAEVFAHGTRMQEDLEGTV